MGKIGKNENTKPLERKWVVNVLSILKWVGATHFAPATREAEVWYILRYGKIVIIITKSQKIILRKEKTLSTDKWRESFYFIRQIILQS